MWHAHQKNRRKKNRYWKNYAYAQNQIKKRNIPSKLNKEYIKLMTSTQIQIYSNWFIKNTICYLLFVCVHSIFTILKDCYYYIERAKKINNPSYVKLNQAMIQNLNFLFVGMLKSIKNKIESFCDFNLG